MGNTEIQAIEQACSKLITQFAVFNDLGHYEELANLFTGDGRYARPTDPDNFAEGRAAILAAFESRPRDKLTRHLITNILVDVTGPASASGFCYVTQYSGSTATPAAKFGHQANAAQLVGEYTDEFVLTASGWKFRQRSGKLIFTT
jgi:hypothetical protein